MSAHPDPADLGAVSPSPELQAHLERCSRCRALRRLHLAALAAPPGVGDTPGSTDTLASALGPSTRPGSPGTTIGFSDVRLVSLRPTGPVFRVSEDSSGRVLALAVLDPIDTAARTLEALAGCRDPFIVRPLEIVPFGEGMAVVRSWIDGDDPGQWADAQGEDAVARLFLQLAGTLLRLHGHDVAHGGLSEDTVRVDAAGNGYLVDVGLVPGDTREDWVALGRLMERAGGAELRTVATALQGPRPPSPARVLGLLGAATSRSVRRYVPVERRRAGVTTELHHALDTRLRRPVLLETVRADSSSDTARRAVVREGSLLARLGHPGIPALHDRGTLPDGRPFLAVGNVVGRTLADALESDALSLMQVVDVVRRVCLAVAHAHDRGVCGPALEPDAIVLGSFGEVVAIDWSGATDAGGPGIRGDVDGLVALLEASLGGRWDRALELQPIRDGLAGNGIADAESLATALAGWLDGAARRQEGLALVARAAERRAEADALADRARALRAEARGLLDPLPAWADEDEKSVAWELEDRAADLDARRTVAGIERRALLHAALAREPDLPEALAVLAEDALDEHAAAERAHDAEALYRAEVALRTHVAALPRRHAQRRRVEAWLRGDGALTLVTDPPGAEVLLHRFVTRNRQLVPVFDRVLGETPLVEEAIEAGSYLCVLRARGHVDVRYPVHVPRLGHHHGVAPGSHAPYPIPLPRPEELGPHDCYVPAGWFVGGGPNPGGPPLAVRSRWLDGFAIRRFPVTNAEYMEFLHGLLDEGIEEVALRVQPRETGGAQGELGACVYGRDADGRFRLQPDKEGDLWLPDHPVLLVDSDCAATYCDWLARTTDLSWRIPGELQWEKAARGVDGRTYPWGEFLDPSWCCIGPSHPARPVPAVVDSYPVDASVYGVRGLAGGVSDLCRAAEGADASGPSPYARRGGAWLFGASRSRCTSRLPDRGKLRSGTHSIRVLRPWIPS